MSSFIITNKCIKDNLKINAELQKYGKDRTDFIEANEFNLIYNHLITPDYTNDYYLYDDKNEIFCVYDGVLSNKESPTSLYKQYGNEFYKYLDGEYSLILIDKPTHTFIACADPFGCRHLSIGLDNDKVGAATFSKPLETLNFKNIFNVFGNTVYIFNLKTKKIDIRLNTIYDTGNPVKDNFTDWYNAFERAIQKRISNLPGVSLTLSDGYDSGMIHCELLNKNISHDTYSHINYGKVDSIAILLNRHKYHEKHAVGGLNKLIFSNCTTKEIFNELHYEKIIDYDAYTGSFYEMLFNNESYDLQSLDSIRQMSEMVKLKKKSNVVLTGIEGEIHYYTLFYNKDYCLNFSVSDIARAARLTNCCFGVDVRFPFLDKTLYQETLWLNPSTFKEYKSIHKEFLDKFNYPYYEILNNKKSAVKNHLTERRPRKLFI